MASTVTVTGKVGAGVSLTAYQYTGVTSFRVATDVEMLYITSNGRDYEVDITAVTTITCTVSGNSYTLTLS